MASVVLITGANGFIGTYAALLFESLGHRVIPVDIKPRSRDLSLLPIKLATVTLDVTDPAALRRLCKSKKVTHVVHAAHPHGEEGPGVLEFSYKAMQNILGMASEFRFRRVVFLSSGSIYVRPAKENGDPSREDDPVAVYPPDLPSSAKILSEWLGDFYVQRRGLSVVTLRISSVYGPGQSDGIGAAIKEGILGRECRPYLSRNSEDLVYVKDVTEGLRLACFCENPPSYVYNIGYGKACDIDELEQALRMNISDVSFEVGVSPELTLHGELNQSLKLDVSRAREELNFNPQFDLEKGVAAIVDWVRSEKKRLR